jgi:ankyrin repeat domain-containing protein 50
MACVNRHHIDYVFGVDIRQRIDIVGEMRELFVQISDKEALNWLSAVSPDPAYDFNKYRRLEGTCNWIFETQKYQSWIDGSGNQGLWIVGIPGKHATCPEAVKLN